MFKDHRFRADTPEQLKAALAEFAVDDDGDWIEAVPGKFVLKVFHAMIVEDAVYDEADPDVVVTPAVLDTGCHVDLRLYPGFEPDIPEEFEVHPTNPRHQWA